jgi:hypothetical protein
MLASMVALVAYERSSPPLDLTTDEPVRLTASFGATADALPADDGLIEAFASAPELLLREALLPSHAYGPSALRAAYGYARTCDPAAFAHGDLPVGEDLAKAIAWTSFLCSGSAAPWPSDAFFATPPWLHPGGGTYVGRAAALGRPETTDAWLAAHRRQLHIDELAHLAAQHRLVLDPTEGARPNPISRSSCSRRERR